MTGATTYGRVLRATRLGFRASSRHGCYIRLSEPTSGELVVEVVPFASGDFPPSRSPHFVWWEGDPAPLLDACEPLVSLTKTGPPKMPMTWRVSEQGRILCWYCGRLAHPSGEFGCGWTGSP